HSLDLDLLSRLRDQFDLRIVEDCAQSIHATFRGIPTGTIGQLAATSFYPTKNLGALGDGGAVLTQSESLAGAVRVLRDYGQSHKYEHDAIGYNSRLDELHAAILWRAHLPRLASWTARRREIASVYVRNIGHPYIRVPGAPEGSNSCWHLFPVFIEASRKPDFMAHMRGQGIAVAEHYPTPIFEQRAMAATPHEFAGTCEQARQLCASEVSLPIHPYLTDAEVVSIIESCNAWVV
ncbi:MAG: DegT/DnrJ/EryC1/StrS family aminotransferase, partial [Bryobacteraceae bacterium]